jgi:O-antigen/teichoic acid export membrane protein
MIGIIQPVLQPAISDSYVRKDYDRLGRALRTAGMATGLPTILICASFVVFPELWMELIFGPAYRDGAPVLAVLGCGYIVAALIGMPGVALDMTDAQKQFMIATLATGTLTMIGIFAVTERFGAYWLAVVVAVGLVIQRLVFWQMLRHHLHVRSDLLAANLDDLRLGLKLVLDITLRRRQGTE